jgi:hypothetical protein
VVAQGPVANRMVSQGIRGFESRSLLGTGRDKAGAWREGTGSIPVRSALEGSPSGLGRTPGKRVGLHGPREFESHLLRSWQIRLEAYGTCPENRRGRKPPQVRILHLPRSNHGGVA